ncbi:amidohydrolase [Cognatilysobacter tabacisoli]|uniref:amidohydrolase n=1 Tax=Cognatilysobacter tabacisoli TaxID=2315424 RepID=UPI000E6AF1F7|nr:amidohydrolase [Lysobacter tabacisoli]
MHQIRAIAPWLAIPLMLAATAVTAASNQRVTVLTAARIHTMDPAQPRVEALAYDDAGTVVAVGTREALAARYPDASRLDVGASTVVPGLIDAHGHVEGLGYTKLRVDLVGARSKDEVLARLRAFAAQLPAGAWLLGRGWDQNDWPEQRFPTAADLDAAFPDRPVWLERVDGHAGWGNRAAMAAVKRDLTGDWQPDGGRIERDAQRRPTGVFIDAAMALVDAVVPPPDEATAERALVLGMQEAVAHGLTGVHDMGVSLAALQRYRRLADRNAMPLRINALADGDSAAFAWLCENGAYAHPRGRLQMRAVKLYVDGALGSRGAAMLEPYSDDPANRGLLLMQPDALMRIAARGKACGVQLATHAIGDRGNRDVLDAYAVALANGAGDHRWRIEHAQVLAPADIGKLAPLGVIASIQPTHATSDMPWAQERVGAERIHGAYAWRQLRDRGARLALGSDFPVESVDPRLGLYSATTRADAAGQPVGGWGPEEKLTAFEALRGFTVDAAYAGFAEDRVGRLAVGKRADFVVLAQDPLAIEPAALRSLTVQATYVDGEAVYRADAK